MMPESQFVPVKIFNQFLANRGIFGQTLAFLGGSWQHVLQHPSKAHVILVTGPCRALPADIIGDKNFRQSPARPMSS